MRKFFSIIGVIASFFAAEGLYRFGGFISALGGGDAPIYMAMLVIAIAAAVFFVLAIADKLSAAMKWLAVVCLAGSTAVTLLAPSLPVIVQIFVSLLVATLCMLFAPVVKKVNS